jgi:hypothetical protein
MIDRTLDVSRSLPQIHRALGIQPELGALPNKRESRNAISGLTARRSRSNSFTVWRDTRRDLAQPDTVKPYSGKKSSRSITPG